MNQKEITEIKKQYYNDELIEQLIKEMSFWDGTYREVAILNKVKKGDITAKKIAFRGITFKNSYYLKKTFFNTKEENINYLMNDSNLYVGVARIKQIPFFPFDTKIRNSATQKFFKNDFSKYIDHYDLFFDFDILTGSEEKEKADELIKKRMDGFLDEIEKMIKLIVQYSLHAEVVFSGSRGFKILIYNNLYSFNTITRIYNNLVKSLALKYCDSVNSFVPSRLMKCNYSLVVTDKQINIALPLNLENYRVILDIIRTDKTFNTFNIKYLHNVLETYTKKSSNFSNIQRRDRLSRLVSDYNLLSK